jgi:hypothetical protein
MSKSYNTDIVKFASKIRKRNQGQIDDYAKAQQKQALISSIGGALTGVVGAYGQYKQQQQQQQGNSELLSQLGVQGVDPYVAGNLNSSGLMSAILAKRQQDTQNAATAQYLASQGYDNIPAGVDPSIISSIIRNRSTENTMDLTPELSEFAGGAKKIPSGGAQEVLRAFNTNKLRQQYGGHVFVTTDANGNQIAVPINEKTAGPAISAGTGLVRSDRSNESRENIADASIAGRASVAEMQQRAANQRNSAMIGSREKIAELSNENRMQLKNVDAQIQAGNRDASLQRTREALSMRQKQLDSAMEMALVRSDTQLASTGLAFGDRSPIVTEAQTRLTRRQAAGGTSHQDFPQPTAEEAEILNLFDNADNQQEFLSDPDIAPIVKKFRIVK